MNLKKKICFLMIFIMIFLSACGRAILWNQPADDDISKFIKKNADKSIIYLGKEKEGLVTYYTFAYNENSQEKIDSLFDCISQINNEQDELISIIFRTRIPGGSQGVFTLKNYSNESLTEPDLIGFRCLKARYPDLAEDDLVRSPQIYSNLKNIEYLLIDSELQEEAEKEQIDWNILWPELKDISVIASEE